MTLSLYCTAGLTSSRCRYLAARSSLMGTSRLLKCGLLPRRVTSVNLIPALDPLPLAPALLSVATGVGVTVGWARSGDAGGVRVTSSPDDRRQAAVAATAALVASSLAELSATHKQRIKSLYILELVNIETQVAHIAVQKNLIALTRCVTY